MHNEWAACNVYHQPLIFVWQKYSMTSLKPVKYSSLSYFNFATQKYVVGGYQYIACNPLTALCMSSSILKLKPKMGLTSTCHAKQWPTPPSNLEMITMANI